MYCANAEFLSANDSESKTSSFYLVLLKFHLPYKWRLKKIRLNTMACIF